MGVAQVQVHLTTSKPPMNARNKKGFYCVVVKLTKENVLKNTSQSGQREQNRSSIVAVVVVLDPNVWESLVIVI